MARVSRTIAENTNLLPFDQIVKRFEDYMMYVYAVPEGGGGAPDSTISQVDITSVEMKTDYIPAKDSPDKVWMVPVWIFNTQQSYVENDTDEATVGYSIVFRINALDGSLILPSSS